MKEKCVCSPADPCWEVEVLPGAAEELCVVHDAHPVQLIHRHLQIVRVGPGHSKGV